MGVARDQYIDGRFYPANNPIEIEPDCKRICKMAWVWDGDPRNAVFLEVKNQSIKKSFKYSAFDKKGEFVANFRNMSFVRPTPLTPDGGN